MDDDDRDGPESGKDEWEMLGLEKRIDFENLQRVFERLDLNVGSLAPPPAHLSPLCTFRHHNLKMTHPFRCVHGPNRQSMHHAGETVPLVLVHHDRACFSYALD